MFHDSHATDSNTMTVGSYFDKYTKPKLFVVIFVCFFAPDSQLFFRQPIACCQSDTRNYHYNIRYFK